MCEIPSNVILAEEFAKRFDGFSIGSNDLTQLILGVDRDSAELAELFDERDEAVKTMIRDVIRESARWRCQDRDLRPSPEQLLRISPSSWSRRESTRSRSIRTASSRRSAGSPRPSNV